MIKKLLFLILPAVLFAVHVSGQTNTAWSTSQNIGIGTTTPTFPFELLNSSMRSVNTSSYAHLGLESYNSVNWQGSHLYFTRYRGTPTTLTALLPNDRLGFLDFWGYDGTAIQRAGVFGIITDGTPSSGMVPGAFFFQTTGSDGVALERMRINSSGFVGIGTVSPTALLNINGPLTGNSSITFGVAASPGNTNVPMGASAGGYNIDFRTYRDVVPDQIGARIRAERINNYTANSALVQGMDLVFSTSTGVDQSYLTERLRIKNSGEIGIGTSDTKGYKLAVNGSVIATSIFVKLYNTWPDFVFKKDYCLAPLSEVKAYIDLNHHLPEMPAAAEVEKDGINVGEMNKLLVKKVEELTLYLIEKDKKENDFTAKLQAQQLALDNQSKLSHAQAEQIKGLEKKLTELILKSSK